ncbi:MAG: OmpA family protein [Rhodothermales bacterium]
MATGCDASHTYTLSGSHEVSLLTRTASGSAVATTTVPVREDACLTASALNPVYFEENSSALDVNARGFLQENVWRIFSCPGQAVEIFGYADRSERLPEALSTARARAVMRYYTNLGIPEERLRTKGNGVVGTPGSGMARWQYRYAETVLSNVDSVR